MSITKIFKEFSESEQAGGVILIGCTILSLVLANSGLGHSYTHILHQHVDLSFATVKLDYSMEFWINDGMMTIFFLLVGLEIERELYVGELAGFKKALLPILAAVGGMAVPALIHFAMNARTTTQSGFAIPMATDIAFALGILALAGKRVPMALKIFLTALAIIDDLGAITVIALFYTKSFALIYFLVALAIFLGLFIAGKKGLQSLPVFLIAGIIMWYCMLQSGVHATIAGVLLAFAIPFHQNDNRNISYKLQHILHKPVAFIILPIFALANTAIILPDNIFGSFTTPNSLGIIGGLALGKFLGIFFSSYLAVKTKVASLNEEISWLDVLGVSFLGGIGFTMSIFVTNLAFEDPELINASKMSILLASVAAAITGIVILRRKRPMPVIKGV